MTSTSFRAGTTATTAGQFESASSAGARAQSRWSPCQNRPLKNTRYTQAARDPAPSQLRGESKVKSDQFRMSELNL
jgi:hypothetical protein